MPSPFPGMDPYIESPDFWSDFHNDLASAIREQLNRQIRPRYVARLTITVIYDAIEIGEPPQRRVPDVRVTQYQPVRGAPVGMALTASPISATVENRPIPFDDALELASIEIRSIAEQNVVTIIEILSPANKRVNSTGRDEYLRKRWEILQTDVHLVEIDLHRGGARVPLTPMPPAAPYYVILSHGQRRPTADVWAVQLSDPLPNVPVPLRDPDPDALIDLGAAVRTVYERAAYEDEIIYRLPPPSPPLSEAEGQWVDDLLKDYRREAS